MDLKELRKIVELMNEHGLTYFDMSKEGFSLKLKKGQDIESLRGLLASLPQAGPPVGHYGAPPAPQMVPVSGNAESAPTPADGEEISSPMVGTFYSKPSPEADAFVSVGTAVSVGQTLCIIEAMKVMNEIKAERSGTISAVLVEDGTAVQFGDTLFRIK